MMPIAKGGCHVCVDVCLRVALLTRFPRHSYLHTAGSAADRSAAKQWERPTTVAGRAQVMESEAWVLMHPRIMPAGVTVWYLGSMQYGTRSTSIFNIQVWSSGPVEMENLKYSIQVQ